VPGRASNAGHPDFEFASDPPHPLPGPDRDRHPPILHRKETFLTADHPLHAKFARLTQQEEKHGLLDDTATIGTKEGWHAKLNATGFALRGHRLVRG
jgi:hypothetical protein